MAVWFRQNPDLFQRIERYLQWTSLSSEGKINLLADMYWKNTYCSTFPLNYFEINFNCTTSYCLTAHLNLKWPKLIFSIQIALIWQWSSLHFCGWGESEIWSSSFIIIWHSNAGSGGVAGTWTANDWSPSPRPRITSSAALLALLLQGLPRPLALPLL